MKRIHFYLPKPQIETLKTISEKTGICVSEIVRRAIDHYLENRKESKK